MRKKLLITVLLLIMMLACTIFVACGEPTHTHTYGEWQTVTPASCTAEGSKSKVCSCGDEVKEVIPASHIYEWQWLTEGSSYYNVGVCTRCLVEEKLLVTDGLSYNGGTVTGIGSASSFGEIVIPYVNANNVSVTSIDDRAFSGCSGLTSITIPSSITSIGDRTFEYCNKLTIYCEAKNIPSGWNADWNSADRPVIWNCKNNDKDIYGYAYTVVNGVVYRLKDNLATVDSCSTSATAVNILRDISYKEINYSVTRIGSDAFDGCSKLESITIPSSVTSIGMSAFGGCSGLINITIPSSVTSIGSDAFDGCNKLESITFAEGSKLTSIYDYTFRDCSRLTSITIPSSVTSIGDSAFYNCSGLTSITIPSSVTSIGDSAFYNCSGLTVYCEAQSKPSGWDSNWNIDNRPVVWDYKG